MLALGLPPRAASADYDLFPVGQYPESGPAMAVSGHFAYVAKEAGLFYAFDLSNPAQPQLVGNCNIKAGSIYYYHNLVISGTYAYLGCAIGLQVIDISDPANPQQVGTWEARDSHIAWGPPYGMGVSGTTVCVAGPNVHGFVLIDVSNPAQPKMAGLFPGEIWSVDTCGNYAYAADFTQGLQVVDISDPANPHRVNGYQFTNSAAMYIALSGHYAYVSVWPPSGSHDWLHVFDITDLANPQWLGSGPYFFDKGVFSGNFLYIPGSHRVLMFDLSDPVHPQFVGTHYGGSGDMAGYGSYVVVMGEGQLKVFQPRLANPQRVGRMEMPSKFQDLVFAGQYIYASYGAFTNGLAVVDISNPLQPEQVGTYSGPAFNLAASGRYLYTTKGMSGFDVLDISEPANPQRVGGFDTQGGLANSIAVSGAYAYLATSYNTWPAKYTNLLVLDISIPAEPRYVTCVNPRPDDQNAYKVVVSGAYAYVVAGGLHVFDLSNPANPRKVGSFNLLKSITNVVVSGSYAYAAGIDTNNNQGIYSIDCSDPTNPRQAGFYGATTSMLTISGPYAYFMNQYLSDNKSADVLDLSDPAHPKLVGSNPMFLGDNI
jgi:hypothetical protein